MSARLKQDDHFMQRALQLADTAAVAGEVPVGALVVVNNQIVAEGYNQTISAVDPTAHAEVVALRLAARALSTHRLNDATLYVTLEPCLMCCGSLQQARIKRLVYGAREPRTGAVVSVHETLMDKSALHKVAITEGVLAEQCGERLSAFFKLRR